MSRFPAVTRLGLLLGLALLVGCDVHFEMGNNYGFTFTGETAETEDQGTIESGITKVRIVNKFGPVTIRAQSEQDSGPAWQWHGKVWSPTREQAEAYTEELLIDVQTEGSTQTWTLLMPEGADDLKGVESRLDFVLAPSTAVELVNHHGDAEVVNLSGDLDLEQSFGNLVLQQFTQAEVEVNHGEALIEEGQGDLSFEGAFAKLVIRQIAGNVEVAAQHSQVSVDQVGGDVELKTSFDRMLVDGVSGQAQLKNAHGDIQANIRGDVEAENRHGDIQLACGGQRVRLENSHGSIQLKMLSQDFTRLEAETAFDDLVVMLPPEVQPILETKSRFGEVESAFETSSSGSGPRVHLENSHGDIRVKFLPPSEAAPGEAPQAAEPAATEDAGQSDAPAAESGSEAASSESGDN